MPAQSIASACTSCGNLNESERSHCFRCGQALGVAAEVPRSGVAAQTTETNTESFLPGTVLGQGRYQLDSLLGEGGMGTVYKATDLALGRTVALKLLHQELTEHSTARRRMVQEARILANLDHPNVVQLRNVFEEGEVLAIELEFMAAGDLLAAIPAEGMDADRAVAVMSGVLSGLHAIHEAGLVHRDIKPENVLLNDRGTPKVTDLGVAHDPGAQQKTRLGAVLGTPEYMAPEQIQGQAVDSRSDVYAAGLVLYRTLTGSMPFQAQTDFDWQVAHVREAPDIDSLRRRAPAALVAVVERALAKSRDERWESAEAFREALVPKDVQIQNGAGQCPHCSGSLSASETIGAEAAAAVPAAEMPVGTVLFGGELLPLDVERVECHDPAVTDLSRLSRLTHLRYLDLSGSQVRNLGPLAGLDTLEELRLHRTEVSDWQIWRLRAQLKECIIKS